MFHNNRKTEQEPGADETTIVARGVVVRGDLHFAGSLHLEGRVEGTVGAECESALLTVSEQGSVAGEVRVPRAVINGTVEGNIFAAEHLELAAAARVEGDVHYKVLEMAAGARVSGRMVHQPDQPKSLPHPESDEDEVPMQAVEA